MYKITPSRAHTQTPRAHAVTIPPHYKKNLSSVCEICERWYRCEVLHMCKRWAHVLLWSMHRACVTHLVDAHFMFTHYMCVLDHRALIRARRWAQHGRIRHAAAGVRVLGETQARERHEGSTGTTHALLNRNRVVTWWFSEEISSCLK